MGETYEQSSARMMNATMITARATHLPQLSQPDEEQLSSKPLSNSSSLQL